MQIESETTLVSTMQDSLSGVAATEQVDPDRSPTATAPVADRVNLSPEAMALLRESAGWDPASDHQTNQNDSDVPAEVSYADPALVFGTSDTSESESREDIDEVRVGLSANERVRLGQLRMQDAAVRSQQFSKIAVAGSLAGSLNTQFTSGPDGRLYATSGEVDVNTDPGSTPEETLVRANTLRRVSSTSASVLTSNLVQDDVAIHAAQIELAARSEINEEVMNDVVRAVEFDVEVTQRDSAAAAEAANWTAPPEFSAHNAVESDDAAATTTDTILAGAEVVTAPEQTESSRDESQRRAQFLALLNGDGPQPSQHLRSLDIVA